MITNNTIPTIAIKTKIKLIPPLLNDIKLKLAIGKRLKLSPAFPLLHTERDCFPSFRVPSNEMY